MVFAGTHPAQFNGYSRVTYELCSRLASDPETDLFVFGFQSPGNGFASQTAQRKLPPNVHLYDAAACEEPKDRGFGTAQLPAYVRAVRPDVFVVYNDPIIVNLCASAIFGLPEEERRGLLFVPYLDQIYEHIKPAFVKMVNSCSSAVICFTPYWESIFRKQGGNVPTAYLRHGFDASRHYPVPREMARRYFGLNPDDFVFLNLNRNQPRKRWDVCLKAWAEFVGNYKAQAAHRPDASAARMPKLLIGTALTGAWNLLEIYERELGKRGISLEEGQRHLIMLTSPQAMTDSQINILYSAADVGVNTADGEGFGLCTFEHAGIGIPQVASRVGGIMDFLDDDCSALCDEVYRYYVDESRDHVGGEGQMVDPYQVCRAMEDYYNDPKGAHRHGEECRKRIVSGPKYCWDRLAERLSDIVHQVHAESPFAASRAAPEASPAAHVAYPEAPAAADVAYPEAPPAADVAYPEAPPAAHVAYPEAPAAGHVAYPEAPPAADVAYPEAPAAAEPGPEAPAAAHADSPGIPAAAEPGTPAAAEAKAAPAEDESNFLIGKAALLDHLVSDGPTADNAPTAAGDIAAMPPSYPADEVALMRAEIRELKKLLIASLDEKMSK